MFFDGTQKIIGKGAQAAVYFYGGAAYKVYPDGYPAEWIHGEYLIQEEICKTDLPVVRYEKTSDPHILKMEFLDGETLMEYYRHTLDTYCLDSFVFLQKRINSLSGLRLPRFSSEAQKDLQALPLSHLKKEKALELLQSVPEKDCLLHLDFHPLNVMVCKGRYVVIDWINARIGNPVFDLARTYVLFRENDGRIAEAYKALIFEHRRKELTDWDKAVYLTALLRQKENRKNNAFSLITEVKNHL